MSFGFFNCIAQRLKENSNLEEVKKVIEKSNDIYFQAFNGTREHFCRDGEIRTHDLQHPMRATYCLINGLIS
jgi:hypothetical protein